MFYDGVAKQAVHSTHQNATTQYHDQQRRGLKSPPEWATPAKSYGLKIGWYDHLY